MILSELFPEVERYWSVEMSAIRLVAGFATVLIFQLCVLTAAMGDGDAANTLYHVSLAAQALLLLGYGTVRMVGSVMTERNERTWDLQRLTPLTSLEITGGKLLGAPLYAYFLALNFVPWTLGAAALGSGKAEIGLVWGYVLLGSSAFLALSLGLLVSAYSDIAAEGSTPTTAAALMGFAAVQGCFVLFGAAVKRGAGIRYFGMDVPSQAFIAASLLAFGAWAIAGARWRIGRDLLEGRRAWRLPAFMAFVTVYQLGFGGGVRPLAIIIPVLFAYVAGALNRETFSDWKRWLAAKGRDSLDRAPLWVQAALSCLALAALLSTSPRGPDEPEALWRFPLLAAFFLGRDLSFFQWCRFTTSRRPEITAIVYLALAYALPAMLVPAFKLQNAGFWWCPMAEPKVSAAWNLAPGLVQMALAWAVLQQRYESLSKQTA